MVVLDHLQNVLLVVLKVNYRAIPTGFIRYGAEKNKSQIYDIESDMGFEEVMRTYSLMIILHWVYEILRDIFDGRHLTLTSELGL